MLTEMALQICAAAIDEFMTRAGEWPDAEMAYEAILVELGLTKGYSYIALASMYSWNGVVGVA